MEQNVRVEELPAPELPAPPRMKYSDALSAYQIAVAVRGNTDALQKRALRGWSVSKDWGSGLRGMALNGANMLVVFHDVFHESNPGTLKGTADPQRRFVVFGMRAKNDTSGEVGLTSFAGFSSDPGGLPGNYKDQKLAKAVVRKLTLQSDHTGTIVSESFDFSTDDGSVHLGVDYRRGASRWEYNSTFSPQATVFRASLDPSIRRAYWEDLVGYLVVSRPLNVDLSSKLEFDVRIPALADVMDGAQIVSLVVRPAYTRRVFVNVD
jgi:hypothetical protein